MSDHGRSSSDHASCSSSPSVVLPLPVALAVYFTEALFLGALRGAALTAVIVVLAFVLSQ